MQNTKIERPDTLPDLGGFIGTDNWYLYPCPLDQKMLGTTYPLSFTDGVKHVAESANAYWLIDVVMSHAVKIYLNKDLPRSQKMLLECKLVVNDDDSAEFTMTDGNYNQLAAQKISFTDFPAKTIKIWVENGIALLPSEH